MTTRHRRIALLSGASITAIGVSEKPKVLTFENIGPGERIELVSSQSHGRTTVHSSRVVRDQS